MESSELLQNWNDFSAAFNRAMSSEDMRISNGKSRSSFRCCFGLSDFTAFSIDFSVMFKIYQDFLFLSRNEL